MLLIEEHIDDASFCVYHITEASFEFLQHVNHLQLNKTCVFSIFSALGHI